VAALEWSTSLAPTNPPPVFLERPGAARASGPDRPVQSPPLGHAADYRWLVGCLEHDPENDQWHVRYADPGEPDRYGGLLELVSPGLMAGFRAGRLVRVEGELVDPAPLQIKPGYRVRSIQELRR
jgi:hypothetical protein